MEQTKTVDQLPKKSQLKMGKVTIVDSLTREEFYRDYVAKNKPVVIRKMTKSWDALGWNADYFKANEGGQKLAVKTGDVSQGKRESVFLSEYVEALQQYEMDLKNNLNPARPPYLHDVPFFHVFPKMKKDIEPFPLELFPKWYWHNWQNYIQFFMGATGSLTPLHFDTLYTNNLFFQIVGQKRFILIPESQTDLCYVHGWRWAGLNPDNPDFEKHPLAKDVKPLEVVIGPGDILFMPSGMLHQVHGLSYSISFNIDWHTPQTAKKGVMSLFKGAPKQNVYYNFLSYLGLGLKVPSKHIFPYYKSYLNYVS
ncbi:MAG: cupin-like domain-containing protein [Saprospiraceae bacterium]